MLFDQNFSWIHCVDGVRQEFSLAWSPELHGLVEREHFEMVRDTGRALETMAEAKLDQWPLFLPLAEGKRRTRTLPSGHQPIALSRGYYACTTLQTAMGALRAIPAGLPRTTWMRGLVATHKLIMKDELEDRADREAADQLARNLQSHVKPRIFNQGELVLIKVNKDIREGHKLRAKATGPCAK